MGESGPKVRGGVDENQEAAAVNGDWPQGGERNIGEISEVRERMSSGVFAAASDVKDQNRFAPDAPDSSIRLLPVELPEETSAESSYVDSLMYAYEDICRVPRGDVRMLKLHDLFMNSLYSRKFLPLMREIDIAGHFDARRKEGFIQTALEPIIAVLEQVRERAESDGISKYDAFIELYDEAVSGHNLIVAQMADARSRAMECLDDFRSIFGKEGFNKEADLAMAETRELEEGVKLPEEFVMRLIDPKTKVVAISLDFNSTFNLEESYAHPDLVARAQRAFARFALMFRRAFPQKELVMAINTGRPGMYAWGVAESAFMPMNEFRSVAVGESGGVVLKKGLDEGVMDVAVEHPYEWKNELDALKDHILKMIADSQDVVIEPKLSMLSIRIARKGKYLHRATNGNTVDEKWIENFVAQYFKSAYRSAKRDYQEILWSSDEVVSSYARMIDEALHECDCFDDVVKGIRPIFQLLSEKKNDALTRIETRIRTLESMFLKNNLVTKYNPTAGYVDIGHKDLNKFSTLAGHVCKEHGCERDNMLYLQIGDGTTDMLPTENTGVGEVNEGADEAFLVAVANCNENLRSAVEGKGERGVFTVNESVLGVIGLAEGLISAVKEARRLRGY